MLIKVRVHPSAKKQTISKKEENSFQVWVKEPAWNNLANQAVAKSLAKYFEIPLGQIRLKRGFKQKSKIFEIKE